MKRPWVAVWAVVLIAGLAGGCATANAIQSARTSLDKAKAAGAMTKAPFEYYAAEEYLNKADFEVAEGDCKAANVFTKQSQEYSAKALQMAGGGAK
jgi:hypothetical protein